MAWMAYRKPPADAQMRGDFGGGFLGLQQEK
jgi:hypothetical protein